MKTYIYEYIKSDSHLMKNRLSSVRSKIAIKLTFSCCRTYYVIMSFCLFEALHKDQKTK